MTAKTKDKPVEVVKINKVDDERDEVFFYREEPYFNETKYVKTGTFKLGPLSEEAIEKKTEKQSEEG